MIVFSAIVPHSPLLVPSIGKEHGEQLLKTLQAYTRIEEALYLTKPETLIIISPHAPMYPDAFSGNIANAFTGGLKEFGDHGTTISAKVDFLLLDHIHRAMRTNLVPFTLTSQEELDYGFTVPLLLLTPHLPKWKLVPLSVSLLSPVEHYEMGRQLKRVIHAAPSRVALIASADLSHHANANAPEGERPEGREFDQHVRDDLAASNFQHLAQLDQTLTEKVAQCGLKPILMLAGALENINCRYTELCYEAPFGVGYLTAQYDIA